jgi:hypothetical protein
MTLLINLWLKNTALPRKYLAINTFEEGNFFCVDLECKIIKYPIADIWRVEQSVAKEGAID